jgi:hypothetical protein
MQSRSFPDVIAYAWLKAAAYAAGVAATFDPLRHRTGHEEWKAEQLRCERQGRLVLDLVAHDLDLRGRAA